MTALKDVLAVQDEITIAVVTAIPPAIANAELRRVLRKPPEGGPPCSQGGVANEIHRDKSKRGYCPPWAISQPDLRARYVAVRLT
jgi:hypothetical protein